MRPLRRRASLLLCLLAILPAFAEKVATLPAPTGYIDDYAHVLTQDQKRALEHFCSDLHKKTHAQIFVVTIHSLEEASVDDFTHELFGKWKIGDKKTDRGVLLLFSIDDHKRRIEVGDGLQGTLTDARSGDIGRAMVPDLKAARYNDAIRIGLDGVATSIAEDTKTSIAPLDTDPTPEEVAPPPPPTPPQTPPTTDDGVNTGAVFLIVILIGVVLLIIYLVVKSGRSGASTSTYDDSNTTPFFFSSGSTDSSSSSSSDSSSSSSGDDSFSGGDGGSSDGGGSSGDW